MNFGSDLARLFHSVLYCCLLSFNLTDLSSHISLAAFSALWISAWIFLVLSAKSFSDCKYLSTIACACEGTFVESTNAHSLLDESLLFDDMHDAPSWLLFDICKSVSFHRENVPSTQLPRMKMSTWGSVPYFSLTPIRPGYPQLGCYQYHQPIVLGSLWWRLWLIAFN